MADIEVKEENLEEIKEEDTEELGKEEEETPEKKEEEEIDVEKVEIETRPGDDEKVDYGAEIDPDDVKTIGTIVDKQTAGLKKVLQETRDRQEIDSFVQENPEYAKYKPLITKYIQHPAYSKIPVKNIAAMVASNDLIKLGAVKEREAQKKADETKSGGSPVRKSQIGQVDWHKVPKNEFEAQKIKVMRGEV